MTLDEAIDLLIGMRFGREHDAAVGVVLEVAHALARSPYDVAPCLQCGQPTVCLPDGMPLCKECGEKGNDA